MVPDIILVGTIIILLFVYCYHKCICKSVESFFVRNKNNDRILAGEDPREVTIDRIRSVGLTAWPNITVSPTGDAIPDMSLTPPREGLCLRGN